MTRRGRAVRPGFTLVEIMTAIFIIGILLAVAVPSFYRASNGSRAKSCQHNLKQIEGAKERWSMENDAGPLATPAMSNLTGGGYLKATPLCPSSGTYTLGNMATSPVCSVGGTAGQFDAHVLP